jgi:diguanylate cyclase (GGDEF)-like protein
VGVDATAPQSGPDDPAAAIRAVWARRRDQVLARVDVVEEAVAALLVGELSDELRLQASREAHKLAGSAGTFGFPRASELARRLELKLEAGPAPADAGPMADQVLAMRGELAGSGEADGGDEARTARPLVLVCSRDREHARELEREFAARGMRTHFTPPASAAAEAAAHTHAALLLHAGEHVGSDALEVIRRLSTRDDGTHAPPPPVLVIAGDDTLAMRVELARAGARRVLPVDLPADRVVETVLQVVELASDARPTVLALDDDPAVAETITSILADVGVAVTCTDDPDQMWESMRTEPPDLVILDIDMPGTDGIEFCRVIRNDPEFAELPVLFVSGRRDPETLRRIFAAGADDYVAKPIVPVVLATRVSNRLERARLLRELGERDQLTGLVNRHAASRALERLVTTARSAGDAVTLGIVDVDRFKRINDRHGHAAGDRVLRGVADVLRGAFRAEDVVARWGGEEFMVGMYGVDARSGHRRVQDALRRLRDEGVPGAGEAGQGVTFSAGVAELGAHGDDLDALYGAADEALYRAKASGRDRVLEAGTAGEPVERVDVVVVDDDEALAEVLLHSLRTAGLTARAVSDGLEARRLLGGDEPALVARVLILDVDLPGLDGLALLRALARDGVLRRTVALMLTARAVEDETLAALELGAIDHVTKPFSVPILMQRVRRALEA